VIHDKIKRNAPAQVEQTLAEHGAWDAVLFLLTTHRLRQADYEAWRLGESGCLEDLIAGNSTRVVAMLDAAMAHATAMGLVRSQIGWQGWGGCSGQTLRLFHDDAINSRFQFRLSPKEDRPQLDLFMDTPHTVLLNRLRQALLERSPMLDTLFDRAFDEMPNEPALARLDAIRAAMHQQDDDLFDRYHYLNAVVAPIASDEFARGSLDIMAPLWRALASAMTTMPFDPEQPDVHASEAWRRAHAWHECLDSMAQIPDWYLYPGLHQRRIVTLTCMGKQERVRDAWMLYCWHCPESAPAALDAAELKLCGLHRLWEQCSQQETFPGVEYFPALVALYYASGDEIEFEHTDGDSEGRLSFKLIRQLLISEQDCEVNAELRHELKRLSPWLFHAYMAMHSR